MKKFAARVDLVIEARDIKSADAKLRKAVKASRAVHIEHIRVQGGRL